MAGNIKKRQQALKHQRAVTRSSARKKPRSGSEAQMSLRASGSWALHEVLLTKNWREMEEIIQILVARRAPTGQIAVAVLLVDLACLGIKRVIVDLYTSRIDYEEGIRYYISDSQEMVSADLNLVAKIIEEGYYYALDLGFQPDPDLEDALLVIGEADPGACAETIPLGGEDGKPLFIAGPHDNAQAIMDKLTRKLGPEGFNYLVPIGGDDPFFLDADDE